MKERCFVFNIDCGYTSTCYLIRPERCIESMSKTDKFRKLWEKEYGSPIREVLEDLKNETSRKSVENFVIENFAANVNNRS
jgi:hypothetical protein